MFAARALDSEGIDAIEVSGGTPASGDNTPVRKKIDTREQEAYHLRAGKEDQGAVTLSGHGRGRIQELRDVRKKRWNRTGIDYVSLARPFVREPGLVDRWQQGDTPRARCISCNGCYRPGLREGGIYCIVEKAERQKSGQQTVSMQT